MSRNTEPTARPRAVGRDGIYKCYEQPVRMLFTGWDEAIRPSRPESAEAGRGTKRPEMRTVVT